MNQIKQINLKNAFSLQFQSYQRITFVTFRVVQKAMIQLSFLMIYMTQHFDGLNKIMKPKRERYREGSLNQLREERFNNHYSLTQRTKRYDALGDPHTSYYFANPSVKDHLKKFKRAIQEVQYNESERHRVNKLLIARIQQKFKDVVSPKTLVYEKEMSKAELNLLGQKSTDNLGKHKSRQSLGSYTTDQDTSTHVLSKNKHYFKRIEPLNYVNRQLQTEEPVLNAQSQTLKPRTIEPGETVPIVNSVRKTPHLQKRRRQNPSKTQLLTTEQSIYKQSPMRTIKNDQKIFADKLAEELHQKKHDKWVQFLSDKKKLLQRAKMTDEQLNETKN